MTIVLLATGIKVLETLIGSATKLGTSTLVKKAGKTIWDRFKKEPESGENKELLRITRIAYLRASLAACRHLLRSREFTIDKVGQTLKDLEKYLTREIKEARAGDWFRKSQLTEAFEVLINSSDEDQDQLLKKKLQDLLLGEIHQANIFPINAYKDLLINGWREAGKQMDWLELMASSLQEELAKNEVAHSTLQLKFWDELNQKLSGFNTQWLEFENYLSRLSEYHQVFWQKLEDMHIDIRHGQGELGQKIEDAKEEILERMGNPQKLRQTNELTLPPAVLKIFLGRDKELDTLHKALLGKSGKQVQILVNGRGGIGKTSLATQYYHKYQSAYDHTAWLSVTNGISDALISLQKELGLEFQTETQKERRDIVLLKLAQLSGLKLLVLDNANDLEDLREHYDQIHAIKDLHLLITSRIDNFRKTDTLKIEGISEKATVALFREYYSDLSKEEEPLVLSIRKAVNENTLVIELLSKNLSKVNRFGEVYTLEELLNDLLEKGVLQIPRSKPVELSYQEFKKASPEEVISAMYDIYSVPPNQQQLLKCISLLPTERVPFNFLKLILEEIKDFEDGLASLADKGWIEHDRKHNLFKWSPVVQEVVRRKNNEYCKILVVSLQKNLEAETIREVVSNKTNYLVRSAESVLNFTAINSFETIRILYTLGELYSKLGNLQNSLSKYEIITLSINSLPIKLKESFEFQRLLSHSYLGIGNNQLQLAEYKNALDSFQEMGKTLLALTEQTDDKEPLLSDMSIYLFKIGKTLSLIGSWDEAIDYFKKYKDMVVELLSNEPSSTRYLDHLSIAYFKLGDCYYANSDFKRSLENFLDSLSLIRRICRELPLDLYYSNELHICLERIGTVKIQLDQKLQALDHYNESAQIASKLYHQHPANMIYKDHWAIINEKLGVLKEELNFSREALNHYLIYEELQMDLTNEFPELYSFQEGLAESWYRLGSFYFNRNKELSEEYLEKAKIAYQGLIQEHREDFRLQNNLSRIITLLTSNSKRS